MKPTWIILIALCAAACVADKDDAEPAPTPDIDAVDADEERTVRELPPAPPPAMRWLYIFDDTSFETQDGSPGADICGAIAVCDGITTTAVETDYVLGSGATCTAEGPGCFADRADPAAAQDDGSQCGVESNPSDYVALGQWGSIALGFERSLVGCEVTIRMIASDDVLSAFVCDSAQLEFAACLNNDDPVAEGAGAEISFTVPAN